MKILLATDGSDHARIAEVLLTRIPPYRNAEITVATCVAPPALIVGAMQPSGALAFAEEAIEVWEELRKTARATSDAVADRLKSAGLNASAVVLEGDAAAELVEQANENGYDLIAVGSRGHGAIQSWLLGSVARHLVNHSKVSVLVARPDRKGTPADTWARLQTKERLDIAVAVDGSQGGDGAVQTVVNMGFGNFQKVSVICAEPLSILPLGIEPDAFGGTYRYDHDRAKGIAHMAATKLAAYGDTVTEHVELGRPAHVIDELTEASGADLLIMGATRHGTLERWLLGSVSYEAVNGAPCSVLVVRPIA